MRQDRASAQQDMPDTPYFSSRLDKSFINWELSRPEDTQKERLQGGLGERENIHNRSWRGAGTITDGHHIRELEVQPSPPTSAIKNNRRCSLGGACLLHFTS